MGHIFISYSHKDTVYAHALAAHLQGMGFNVWIDERLDYGSQWPQELQKQLDGCSAFILIMSPRSYASDWVQSELQRARRKLKPIFPLLLEGDEPWLSVESTQFYDVRGNLYPDAKFYSALKNVLTASPAAQTLKAPGEAVGTRLAGQAARPKWVVPVLGGILLIAVAAGAGLLMRPSPQVVSTPVWTPTTAPTAAAAPATVSVPPTQTPESRPTSQPTLPAVVSTDEEMVLVPAGEFSMGRNAADELAECLEKFHSECQLSWFLDAEPIHEVSLEDFYIDLHEVTNAGYKACEDAGVCEPPRSSLSNTRQSYYGNAEFDNYPVIQVTWEQARTYCEWREARLPTEAEWEKAARGTDERPYPWGEELSDAFANFNWNIGDTTAVGSYEDGRSPYGVYDMAGNVWEWVSSLHRPYPYNPNDGRESLNANGLRVMRGGSWGQEGDNSVSSTYRFGYDPARTNIDLGFRCARDGDA